MTAALKDWRREAFAQAVALGKSAARAYLEHLADAEAEADTNTTKNGVAERNAVAATDPGTRPKEKAKATPKTKAKAKTSRASLAEPGAPGEVQAQGEEAPSPAPAPALEDAPPPAASPPAGVSRTEWAAARGARVLQEPLVARRVRELRLDFRESLERQHGITRQTLADFYAAVLHTPVGELHEGHPLAQEVAAGGRVKGLSKLEAAKQLALLAGFLPAEGTGKKTATAAAAPPTSAPGRAQGKGKSGGPGADPGTERAEESLEAVIASIVRGE